MNQQIKSKDTDDNVALQAIKNASAIKVIKDTFTKCPVYIYKRRLFIKDGEWFIRIGETCDGMFWDTSVSYIKVTDLRLPTCAYTV